MEEAFINSTRNGSFEEGFMFLKGVINFMNYERRIGASASTYSHQQSVASLTQKKPG